MGAGIQMTADVHHLTDEQRQALDCRDVSVALSAGADELISQAELTIGLLPAIRRLAHTQQFAGQAPPLQDIPTNLQPNNSKAQPPGATILIVDDEVWARFYVRELLAEAGHQTVLAGSGESALELAADHQFDLA